VKVRFYKDTKVDIAVATDNGKLIAFKLSFKAKDLNHAFQKLSELLGHKL